MLRVEKNVWTSKNNIEWQYSIYGAVIMALSL